MLLKASKVGYYIRETGWTSNDTWISMHNKVGVVTGASSGLGKAVSLRLAALGARVYLLCRNKARGAHVSAGLMYRPGALDGMMPLALTVMWAQPSC